MSVGLGYRRADLKAMAEAKLSDAILLLENDRFSNAYYLAGYSVEFALKACISRQILAETIPDRKWINDIYSHQFEKLIGLAGLSSALKDKQETDQVFAANWLTVREWTEGSRYEMIDRYSCGLMIEAIRDEPNGVLTWLRQHW